MRRLWDLFFSCIVVLAVVSGVALVLYWFSPPKPDFEELPLPVIQQWIQEGRVIAADFYEQDQVIVVSTSLGTNQAVFATPSAGQIIQQLNDARVSYEVIPQQDWIEKNRNALRLLLSGAMLVMVGRYLIHRYEQRQEGRPQLPDENTRRRILREKTRRTKFRHICIDVIAQFSEGLTREQVASIPRKSLKFCKSRGLQNVTQEVLERVTIECVIEGKLAQSESPEAQHAKNLHVSGCALVAYASPHMRFVAATSFLSGNDAQAWICQSSEKESKSREEFIWEIAIYFAGHEAKKLRLDPPHNASGVELESAARIALVAVCQYGLGGEFIAGACVEHWEDHPQAKEINEAVQKFIEAGRRKAAETLRQYWPLLEQVVDRLAQKRILFREDIEELDASTKTVEYSV